MSIFETMRRLDKLISERVHAELMEAQQHGHCSIAQHPQLRHPGFHARPETLNGAAGPGSTPAVWGVGVQPSR